MTMMATTAATTRRCLSLSVVTPRDCLRHVAICTSLKRRSSTLTAPVFSTFTTTGSKTTIESSSATINSRRHYHHRHDARDYQRITNNIPVLFQQPLLLWQPSQHPYQKRSMVVVSQHKGGAEAEVASNTTTPPIPNNNTTNGDNNKNSNTPTLPVNNQIYPVPKGEHHTFLLDDNYLIITDSCWKHMERLAQKKGFDMDQVYLRVFVDAGGCSGFTYQFEFHCLSTDNNENDSSSSEEEDNDNVIEDETEDLVWRGPHGLRVVVDTGSMDLLRGSTLDYVVEMIKSSFEIRDNPQSESACGCGSSFAVKNFSANPAID